ncbi:MULTISPECIES: LCP family protein [Bacillus]|nr:MULTISPECIES: LCP family protein [Bacillus]MBP1081455.1 LCP family protein required for cell wall assembly [Bacillus capparidis]MED1096126.1 LCP family protein [Bacillus capparidis]
MNRTDLKKQKKRKFRWFRFILFLMVFILIAGTAYWIVQYNSGKSAASEDAPKKEDYQFDGSIPNNGEMNVLLLGSDSRGEELARTDTIMIAHYSDKQKQPKLISIMRDSYVSIPGYGNNKINAAFAFGGPDLLRKTIEENFGIDINYYAIVDFEGFEKVADIVAPNGIKVNVPHKMSEGIGMTLQPGEQTLKGKQLLGYVRYRKDTQSDFGRVARQQEVLSKMKEEATDIESITQLPKILGTIEPYVTTNVPSTAFLGLGRDIVLGDTKEVDTLRIPVDGSYTDQSYSNIGSVLDLDIEENSQAIKDFLAGKASQESDSSS